MIAPGHTDSPTQSMVTPAVTQRFRGPAGRQLHIDPDVSELLGRFRPISLSEMEPASLQDRTDTKFVMNTQQLSCVLESLTGSCRVLEIDNVRLHHYQTLYFDTADFSLYMRHHAGGRNRYKVRSREYVNTRESFLEVKLKTNKNRTIKNRIRTSRPVTPFSPETDGFMSSHFPLKADLLEPKLWNGFYRITLAGEHFRERMTLDLDLRFRRDGRACGLPGVVVAEVKQNGASHDSDFISQMRALRLRPTRFSKYCFGVCMLYQEVKHNNFKRRLRIVDKILEGDHVWQRAD